MAAQLGDVLLWMYTICVTLGGKEHPTEKSPVPSVFFFLHTLPENCFTVDLQSEIHLCKHSHPHTSQSVTLLIKSAERNTPFTHSVHLTPRQTSQIQMSENRQDKSSSKGPIAFQAKEKQFCWIFHASSHCFLKLHS